MGSVGGGGGVEHLFSIICWFWLCLLASCVLHYVLCVCLFVCLFGLFGCFVTCVACYLWIDRVVVRVGVRSKLGVDGLKETDG